uniref:Uncharacterized protein n=1 Tax=Arion vulgaris TaxID=1028688 RepID=A0A0B7AYG6_9EUPU
MTSSRTSFDLSGRNDRIAIVVQDETVSTINTNRASPIDTDFDLSVLQLPGTSDLNFDGSKHKRNLSQKGSISHRRRPTRLTVHASNDDLLFVDSTEPMRVKEEAVDANPHEGRQAMTQNADDKVPVGLISHKKHQDERTIPGFLEDLRKSQVFNKTDDKEERIKLPTGTNSTSSQFSSTSSLAASSSASIDSFHVGSKHALLEQSYAVQKASDTPTEYYRTTNDALWADTLRNTGITSRASHRSYLLEDEKTLFRLPSMISPSTKIDMQVPSCRDSTSLPELVMTSAQFPESTPDDPDARSPTKPTTYLLAQPTCTSIYKNSLSMPLSYKGTVPTFRSDEPIEFTKQRPLSIVISKSDPIPKIDRVISPAVVDEYVYTDSMVTPDSRLRSSNAGHEKKTWQALNINIPELSGLSYKETAKPVHCEPSFEIKKLNRSQTILTKSSYLKNKHSSASPNSTDVSSIAQSSLQSSKTRLVDAIYEKPPGTGGISLTSATPRRRSVTENAFASAGYYVTLEKSTSELKPNDGVIQDGTDVLESTSMKSMILETGPKQRDDSSDSYEDGSRPDGLYSSSLNIQLGRRQENMAGTDVGKF